MNRSYRVNRGEEEVAGLIGERLVNKARGLQEHGQGNLQSQKNEKCSLICPEHVTYLGSQCPVVCSAQV